MNPIDNRLWLASNLTSEFCKISNLVVISSNRTFNEVGRN